MISPSWRGWRFLFQSLLLVGPNGCSLHIHVNGVRLCHWTVATSRPFVHPLMRYMNVESHSGMILLGKLKNSRKNCLSSTLSTTSHTWTNLDIFSDSLATNHLGHAMACPHIIVVFRGLRNTVPIFSDNFETLVPCTMCLRDFWVVYPSLSLI